MLTKLSKGFTVCSQVYAHIPGSKMMKRKPNLRVIVVGCVACGRQDRRVQQNDDARCVQCSRKARDGANRLFGERVFTEQDVWRGYLQ